MPEWLQGREVDRILSLPRTRDPVGRLQKNGPKIAALQCSPLVFSRRPSTYRVAWNFYRVVIFYPRLIEKHLKGYEYKHLLFCMRKTRPFHVNRKFVKRYLGITSCLYFKTCAREFDCLDSRSRNYFKPTLQSTEWGLLLDGIKYLLLLMSSSK